MKKKTEQPVKAIVKQCMPGERIECKHGGLEPIDKLIPNPANPNRHSDEQIQKLAKLIELHGWRLPIVVSNRSGMIVSGHGRLLAAKRLGLNAVPVDFQDFRDEAEEIGVLISDNVIADLSSFDGLKMAEIINELDNFNVDLEAFTALDNKAIMNFIHGPDALSEDGDVDIPDAQSNLIIECSGEEEQSALYQELTGRGYKVRLQTL